jgi:hypothetical protein
MTQILTLSREGRWEELRDFLARRGIAILDESPCIVRKTFIVLCVGDRVTIYYRGGVRTGVVAGFSADGMNVLLLGCKGERSCQSVSPSSIYLPLLSSVVFREYSPFHESYASKVIMDYLGLSGESGEEG